MSAETRQDSGALVKPLSVATNAKNIRARDTKVIAAAWRLIAREGVLALTVKALADEAGVAVSSMRYTMPSQARGARGSTASDRAEHP